MAAMFNDTFVDPVSKQPQANAAGDAAAERYCILNEVNSGSFGVVYRAWDNETGEFVAIKHETEGLSLSTRREIFILKSLPPHPSVVALKDALLVERRLVLVVMEYLPTDLRRLIHDQTRRMPFTLSEVKKMMKQILEGVAFLHGNGIMHRDLKPANILFDTKKDQLKICDFGLSRKVLGEGSGRYTPGVVTQWYRSPELLLGATCYTPAIDMWSVGCIMGELVLREVLFQGNGSEINQMVCIGDNMQASGSRLRARLDEAAKTGRGPRLSSWGRDLLMRMLEMDVEKRITAQEAINHPWFTEFYGLQLENYIIID